jgi:tol-pal system protein YbgF
MMMRACATIVLFLCLAAPAAAQTPQEGQMRLYIQELEERVRQLTGENERLAYELNQLRSQLGMAGGPGDPAATGAVTGGQTLTQLPPDQTFGDADQIGAMSVSPDDPLIAPDGAVDGAPVEGGPVDLSTLAAGAAPELQVPEFGNPVAPGQQGGEQVAALPEPTTALSGSANDEYDLAYGYVLTGDYRLAEESFKRWIAAFPGDQRAADAQFWLGESQLQQGEYRDAATSFLGVYKSAPESNKAPDALMKLGVSLAALGETETACATFAEVGRRYPAASPSLMSRVDAEKGRAGC